MPEAKLAPPARLNIGGGRLPASGPEARERPVREPPIIRQIGTVALPLMVAPGFRADAGKVASPREKPAGQTTTHLTPPTESGGLTAGGTGAKCLRARPPGRLGEVFSFWNGIAACLPKGSRHLAPPLPRPVHLRRGVLDSCLVDARERRPPRPWPNRAAVTRRDDLGQTRGQQTCRIGGSNCPWLANRSAPTTGNRRQAY